VSPKGLGIAAAICFLLFVVVIQSGLSTGDPSRLAGVLGLAWPVMLMVAVSWAIVRRVRD
jgi:hypothetical protein